MIEYLKPDEIEKRSFEIISSELPDRFIESDTSPILKRVIHTTADFDYINTLKFSDNVVPYAIELIKNGCVVVTDTNMVMAGISKPTLRKSASEIYCFMTDETVVKEAKARGVTRATVSMERASSIKKPLIFAIGNAPTALLKLDEMIKEKTVTPALIVAVPVGFVNVIESKELIIKSGVPHIVSVGRKGGSNVAAAIMNALLYLAFPREVER